VTNTHPQPSPPLSRLSPSLPPNLSFLFSYDLTPTCPCVAPLLSSLVVQMAATERGAPGVPGAGVAAAGALAVCLAACPACLACPWAALAAPMACALA
jgi:hypothetical protein